MNLELEGKLLKILEEQSGEGKNGRWLKHNFVLETDDIYPKKVCITLWNDKAKMLDNFKIGDAIKASINIESREYNEKWYTDVTAWRLEKSDQVNEKSSASTPLPDGDDLPFLDKTEDKNVDDIEDFPF